MQDYIINKIIKNKAMKTFDEIRDNMDSNGYGWFDYDNYKAKNNKPCFISENSEDLYDVESWQSMFTEALETIKTKDFLLAVCEHYEADDVLEQLEETDENDIDFNYNYLDITGCTPEQFAEDFMDDYFLGGDEVWCSLSTKLQNYTM